MSNETSPLSHSQWKAIDARVKRVDEDRWISSRFAPEAFRHALIALYALAYELARVRLAVTEETLGAIRFQWWRDALSEIEAEQAPRAHDVCLALNEEIACQRLKVSALQKLVDGYQAAYEANDRSLEPEAWLAGIAANILAGAHGWGQVIREVAPAYAATRRSETKAFGPHVAPAPKSIRPAIAHFRLRKFYCEGRNPNAITKRFCIMKAISTGQV